MLKRFRMENELKLYCTACGVELLFYRDTRTCKRCGITLCSECDNLRDKFQQIASNERDRCSGCRTVVNTKKSHRSKNITLTVPEVNDSPTDYEGGKYKHKNLGTTSTTTSDHEELLLNNKDGSKAQQFHDPVQKSKRILSKIQSENENLLRSHCKVDGKIKETSVDTAGNIFVSRKVHASQSQFSRHFTSLPAENVCASTTVSTSVSPKSKEKMFNSIQNDNQDTHKEVATQLSESVHSTYSSTPIDMSPYSSKSIILTTDANSRSQTAGANSRFDGLTSADNAMDEGLSDMSSDGKTVCSENGEACRNNKTKADDTHLHEKNSKELNTKLDRNRLPLLSLQDNNLNETDTQNKSSETVECYIAANQCVKEFIGTRENKLEIQKTQSGEMSDDRKSSSQAIPVLDKLSLNSQVLTDKSFCDRKFSPESSNEPRVNLNETKQPSVYIKDNGIKVYGHEKLCAKSSSMCEKDVYVNMKSAFPELLEEHGNSVYKKVPTLRYLSYSALQFHDSKTEREKNISKTQADEFDSKSLSFKDTQRYAILDEVSKETPCQFESETPEFKLCKTLESKVSELECQTPGFKTHMRMSNEEPLSSIFEKDMKLKSDNQDSRKSKSNTRTIVKYTANESTSNTLPKEIIFVAEQDTIHLYKFVNQSDDTDFVNKNINEKITEEESTPSNTDECVEFQQEVLSNKTGTQKSPDKKSQTTNCPLQGKHHATTYVTRVRPDALVKSFEKDIVSGLGNSPEDENNLCDNLLPNQIKYMSLMRQTDGSGKTFFYDIKSVQALSPDYLEKMASGQYEPHICRKEQDHQLESGNTVYNSTRSDSDNSESSVLRQPEFDSSKNELEEPDGKLSSVSSHFKKALFLNEDNSTEPFKSQLNTSDILAKENGVLSETDMHVCDLPNQDCTSHNHKQPDSASAAVESTISDDKIPVHTTGTERIALEKERDISLPCTTKPGDNATQHLTDKTRIPGVNHKHSPTLEDIAEKHHQSKGDNEKEKRQIMIETMLAAIEAGILPPKRESSEKSSEQKEVDKQNQSKREAEKRQTVAETLLAAIEAGILTPGSESFAKSSKSKQMLQSFFQQEQIIQWSLTISRVTEELDNAWQSNDPKRISSAYTEYAKKCQECSSWLSALPGSFYLKEKDQVESSDEESLQMRATLTKVSEGLSKEAQIAAVMKELMENITETNNSSVNTDVYNAVFGKEPSTSPLTSDATSRNVFSEMVTTILSAFLSCEKESKPYLSDLHSPVCDTSHEPLKDKPSDLQKECVKKPFTGRLLKNLSHKDSSTGKECTHPHMKHNVKSNVTKKNKNVLPVKTSKSKPDKEITFKLGEHLIENSDKYRLELQEDGSNYSVQSDLSGTDSNSSEWELGPLYSCTSHSEETEEIVNEKQPLANKLSANGEYYKEDFQDLHHAKAHNSKDWQSEYGTHTVSGQPRSIRGQGHQNVDLGEQLETIAKAIGTTVFHVPSDGNCMFSAIVDQLKLLGNFKYTPRTLREKAVQYLRDNPIHEDGTPLECFLSSESWESYLSRMSQENTWGDHLMLNGIAELLECKLLIATVTREQSSTNEIEPTRCKPSNTLTIGLKGEAHFESLRPMDWEERLIRMAKEPMSTEPRRKPKKKKPQLAFAVILAEGRHLMKSHSDIPEHQTDSSDEDGDLEARKQYTPDWLLSDKHLWDPVSDLSTPHLSYILRLLYTEDRVLNRKPMDFNDDEWSDRSDFGDYYLVGPTFQGTEAYIHEKHRNYHVYGCRNRSVLIADDYTETPDWSRYFCMKDTKVVSSEFKASNDQKFKAPSDQDLVQDEATSPPGYLKLVPVNEASFSNQLVPGQGDKKLLKNLKAVNHKTYVQSQYKYAHSRVEENPRNHKAEDVIVFHAEWPQVASEWVDRHRPSGWPEKKCIRECVEMGCLVVPAEGQTGEASKDEIMWEYSFAEAEGYLIPQCLAKNQLHTFRIFKVLLDECIHCPDVLSTETLTQIFLFASEMIPLQLWYANSSACILFMIEYLQRQIEIRYIPNYFITARNMLTQANEEMLGIIADRLQSFRHFPLVYMLTCAEKFYLGDYLVNVSVQTTIQDMQKFKKQKNMATAVKGTFSPLLVKHAKTWINQSYNYELGYSQIVAAYEELSRGLAYGVDKVQFDSFISETVRQNLSGYPQWMFVFYTKITYKVKYSPEVFGRMPCHTLRDIIGEAAGRFGNEVVPDNVSYHRFPFLIQFINLLFANLRLYSDTIPITKYAIQQFQDQLIELSNEDVQTYNSEGVNPNYHLQLKQHTHNKSIFTLYCTLFNAYHFSGKTDSFLPYLPEAERVCERIYEEYEYKSLLNMCKHLKLKEKVKGIQEKITLLREEGYEMNSLD